MKQLLIVRVPFAFPPDQVEPLNNRISARLNANYDVVVTVESGIERIEFEIVFNPHFQFIGERFQLNGDGLAAMEMQEERLSRPTDSTRSTHTQCFREGSLAR